MLDEAYAKLPESIVVVGARVGFHDDGGRLARSLRARFLARLLARLAEGSDPSEATLQDDAEEILAPEARSSDIFLTACILLQSPGEVRALVAGNYDVWHAAATGIRHVLAGASAWNAAAAAGSTLDGMYKNMCVSALSSERSRSVVQTAHVPVGAADTLLVTRGDVAPDLALRHAKNGGCGEIVIALDDGPEIDLGSFGRFLRETEAPTTS